MDPNEREMAIQYRRDRSLQEVVHGADQEMHGSVDNIIHKQTSWNIGRIKVICHFLKIRTFKDLGDLSARIADAPKNVQLTDNEETMLRAISNICRSEDAYLNFVVRAYMQKQRDEHLKKQRPPHWDTVDTMLETNTLRRLEYCPNPSYRDMELSNLLTKLQRIAEK